MSSKSLGDDIYTGAADFGKFMTLLGLIFGIIFAIVGTVIAIFLILRKNKYTKTVIATIVNKVSEPTSPGDSSCLQHGETVNNSVLTYYNCNLWVKYDVDGNNYISNIRVDSTTNYRVGDSVTISYNPENPRDIAINPVNTKFLGWFLLLISLVVLVFACFQYYIVKRFKFAAAGAGVSSVINMIR